MVEGSPDGEEVGGEGRSEGWSWHEGELRCEDEEEEVRGGVQFIVGFLFCFLESED